MLVACLDPCITPPTLQTTTTITTIDSSMSTCWYAVGSRRHGCPGIPPSDRARLAPRIYHHHHHLHALDVSMPAYHYDAGCTPRPSPLNTRMSYSCLPTPTAPHTLSHPTPHPHTPLQACCLIKKEHTRRRAAGDSKSASTKPTPTHTHNVGPHRKCLRGRCPGRGAGL